MKLWKAISKYEPELLLTIPFHFIQILGNWVKRLTRQHLFFLAQESNDISERKII